MESEDDSGRPVWGNPAARSRVYSMIFDYVFHESWQEFSQAFTVDSETDRDFISALLQKVGQSCGDDSYEIVIKSHLLHLMVLLCDAKTSLVENGDTLTRLERALDTLRELDLEDLKELTQRIRSQAVIVCCRDGDWDLARKVYQRLWPNGHADLSAEQKILQSVLHQKNGSKLLKKFGTYDKFLKHAQESLQTIVETFQVPLLHCAGLRIAQHELNSAEEEEDDSEFDTADELPDGDESPERNDNNNNKLEMMKSLELSPTSSQTSPMKLRERTKKTKSPMTLRERLRKTETQSKQDEQPDEETDDGQDVEEEDDVEFSSVEISKRELRSRTVAGYKKPQMTLSPKKAPGRRTNATSDEESIDTADYDGQDESLVMDFEAVAGDSDTNMDENVGSDGETEEGRLRKEAGRKRGGEDARLQKDGVKRLRSGTLRQEGNQDDSELDEDEPLSTLQSSMVRNTQEGIDTSRLRSLTVDVTKIRTFEEEKDKDATEREGDQGQHSAGNDGMMAEGGGLGEAGDGDPVASFQEEDAPNVLVVQKILLRNAFSKMGFGREFRDGVKRDLASLRKSLIASKNKRRRSINPPSEDGPEPPPTATSTPSKTNRATKDLFAVPSPVKERGRFDVHEAGPSGVTSGNLPGNYRRKKLTHLRDLERACDEEDGERVIFSSDDDYSDSDEESIISKAVLKSPKLRKSLQPSSRPMRKKWTSDEVKMLIKGVQKFGVGRWSEIKTYYDFEGRTNVNLKDKWRILQKKFNTSSPTKMHPH